MSEKQIFQKEAGQAPSELAVTIARNVRRLRTQRGFSTEEFAFRIGLDEESLSQIEGAGGQPSLALAWRVADALGVPFTALVADQVPRGAVVMRKDKAPAFASGSLGFSSRALLPHDERRAVEFYELSLAPHWEEKCDAHAPGTSESLHVAEGALEVRVGREEAHLVAKGDTITFPADLPHTYRNVASVPARLYLLMTYQNRPSNTLVSQPFF